MTTTQIQVAERVSELLEQLESHGDLPEGAADQLLLPVSYIAASILAEALIEIGCEAQADAEPEPEPEAPTTSSPFAVVGDGWEFRSPHRNGAKL